MRSEETSPLGLCEWRSLSSGWDGNVLEYVPLRTLTPEFKNSGAVDCGFVGQMFSLGFEEVEGTGAQIQELLV